jgi:hypothetical protein
VKRLLAGVALVALAAIGCSGDDEPGAATTTAVPPPSSEASTTTGPEATTTAGEETTTTAGPVEVDQPVLFPVDGSVLDDPSLAADGFMAAYLPRAEVTLGEFQQGDPTSGEIAVLFGGENGTQAIKRSTLLLRQIGGGWYVTGAASEFVTIDQPEPLDTVPAGPLTVEGAGRGFEALVAVRALPAGGGAPIDEVPGSGGSAAEPQPYSVELDLAGAARGEVVAIFAAGGVGLEEDPGEFSAVAVRIG